eukprot:NODE_10821_length_1326_cov_7.391159.p1 GENE.NODE_10821_length_1326_cov_7.391159~~NODE_10821_length_1326_cov_7.391159.p1  ORF type:complete len:323 (+),score=55.07 NODE_10821_length_1326_cov_7.391159:69-1037(+)
MPGPHHGTAAAPPNELEESVREVRTMVPEASLAPDSWMFRCCAVPDAPRLGEEANIASIIAAPLNLSFKSVGMKAGYATDWSPPTVLTKKQLELRSRLKLPTPEMCCGEPLLAGETTEGRHRWLLDMYQDFAFELYEGMFLKQLRTDICSDRVHCQLVDDLETLKLDFEDGCIIEFPLSAVSQVRHLLRHESKWYSMPAGMCHSYNQVIRQDESDQRRRICGEEPCSKGDEAGPEPAPTFPPTAEHIIVMQFQMKQLAFSFATVPYAQRFMTCIELMISMSRHRPPDRTAATCMVPTPSPRACMAMLDEEEVDEPGVLLMSV